MVNIMMKKEFWSKDIKQEKVNVLKDDIDVDILIIGGGLTGLNTAYYLRDTNLNICLVEQGIVGMGVTSRTTGKINYLQETIYSDLEKKYSYEVARKYYYSQKFAIDEIKRIIEKESIDCNLERVSSYVYTNKIDEVDKIKREKSILKKFGCNVREHNKLSNGLDCKYGISVNDTYVFHPLKYLYKLKELVNNSNIKIYENTRIKYMKHTKEGYVCFTDTGKIGAKKVILACHYPFFLIPYMMPLKVYTEKSYVTVSKVKDYKNESYITSSLPVTSVRYYKDDSNYMFYLSNSHNICNRLDENSNFSNVIRNARKIGINPEYAWSNDDMMSVDGMAYIGKLEKDNDNLLIGTAYSTWGMTNSLLAGFILSNMIKGYKTNYDELFDPLRVVSLSNIGSYMVNIGSSLKSIVENKLVKNKDWYSNNVKFEVRNGKKIAIYNDGEKEHIVLSNCPHMGCTLVFNEYEKTWDCPCHASRYNIDGKCIKGPSTYDISYKKE